MADRKKIAAIVASAVKRFDSKLIVQGTFLDDASGRVVVTIVKGTRKTLTSLQGKWFDDAGSEQVTKAIEKAVRQLDRTPIG